jgi:hypothetical protein
MKPLSECWVPRKKTLPLLEDAVQLARSPTTWIGHPSLG